MGMVGQGIVWLLWCGINTQGGGQEQEAQPPPQHGQGLPQVPAQVDPPDPNLPPPALRPPVSFGPLPPRGRPARGQGTPRALPRPPGPQGVVGEGEGRIYDLTRPSTPARSRRRRRASRSLPALARRRGRARGQGGSARPSARPPWRAEEGAYATVRDDCLEQEGRELEVVVAGGREGGEGEEEHYQTPHLSQSGAWASLSRLGAGQYALSLLEAAEHPQVRPGYRQRHHHHRHHVHGGPGPGGAHRRLLQGGGLVTTCIT